MRGIPDAAFDAGASLSEYRRLQRAEMGMMTSAEIKRARERLDLSQSQLAALMDMEGEHVRGQISRIERGAVKPPVRFVRLLQAYLDGYRPVDWPE